jgi:hypothetical protein
MIKRMSYYPMFTNKHMFLKTFDKEYYESAENKLHKDPTTRKFPRELFQHAICTKHSDKGT